MTLLVISPHLDDAIFSVGEHIANRPGAVIVCPFGGYPPDDIGNAKYRRLHAEHEAACLAIGATFLNGPFLDDVYDPPPPGALEAWLATHLVGANEIWSPLGIHHPDHVRVADAMDRQGDLSGARLCIYQELPYRVLYPDLARERMTRWPKHIQAPHPAALERKQAAVRCYESQIRSDIERHLYVPEGLVCVA